MSGSGIGIEVTGTTPYRTVSEFQLLYQHIDLSRYGANLSTTVSSLIVLASSYVDNFLGYSLNLENITNEESESFVDSDMNLIVYTGKIPIQSVSSLKIFKGTTEATLTLTDSNNENKYIIAGTKDHIIYPDSEQNIVSGNYSIIGTFASIKTSRFWTRINYQAGYSTIPNDILLAIDLVIMYYLQLNLNSLGANSIGMAGLNFSFNGESELLKQAKQILQKYIAVSKK